MAALLIKAGFHNLEGGFVGGVAAQRAEVAPGIFQGQAAVDPPTGQVPEGGRKAMTADVADLPNLLMPLGTQGLGQARTQGAAADVATAMSAYQQFLADRGALEIGHAALLPSEAMDRACFRVAGQQRKRHAPCAPTVHAVLPLLAQSETILGLGRPGPGAIHYHQPVAGGSTAQQGLVATQVETARH